MSAPERAAIAAFSRSDPAVARFLAAIPASSAWVVDTRTDDPVSLNRICGPLAPRGCTLTPPLATVNATIRRASHATEQVVVVASAGTQRMIELRSLPAPGVDGDVIMTARDVTAEEALKAKLRASASEVRELRLAASVSDVGAVHLALSDPLTGLPNRRAFDLEIDGACRNGGFALALFDLDRFKSVNDELGHPVGDRLLRAVGEELRRHTRSADFVARLGGDEFAVLLYDLGDAGAAREAAERLLRSVSARVDLGDVDLSVGLSVGLALHRAGDDPAAIYAEADKAMHTAKARRRGSLVVSDEVATGLTARDALKTVASFLSGRPVPLSFTAIEDGEKRAVAHEIAVGGTCAAAFDQVFSTAARFGHGHDLAAAVLRRAAEAAAASGHAGPIHLRLPVEAVELDGIASLVVQSLARACARTAQLAIEIPLAACTGHGPGESVAARLADAGITVVLGDWDMSFAAFRAATNGRFSAVSLDAACAKNLSKPLADVWRCAFASLAASDVAVRARNVGSTAEARMLAELGVTLFSRPSEVLAASANAFPHFA